MIASWVAAALVPSLAFGYGGDLDHRRGGQDQSQQGYGQGTLGTRTNQTNDGRTTGTSGFGSGISGNGQAIGGAGSIVGGGGKQDTGGGSSTGGGGGGKAGGAGGPSQSPCDDGYHFVAASAPSEITNIAAVKTLTPASGRTIPADHLEYDGSGATTSGALQGREIPADHLEYDSSDQPPADNSLASRIPSLTNYVDEQQYSVLGGSCVKDPPNPCPPGFHVRTAADARAVVTNPATAVLARGAALVKGKPSLAAGGGATTLTRVPGGVNLAVSNPGEEPVALSPGAARNLAASEEVLDPAAQGATGGPQCVKNAVSSPVTLNPRVNPGLNAVETNVGNLHPLIGGPGPGDPAPMPIGPEGE